MMRILGTAALLAFLAAPALAEQGEAIEPEAAAAAPSEAPTPPSVETTMEPAATMGSVARATFTSAIEGREPVDAVSELGNDQGRVFFFTELHGLTDATVIHRWEWNGAVMAEVPITVGGPRWRAYSSKNLEPTWLGEWTVSVVDESGAVLSEKSFSYVTAEPEAPASGEGESAPADLAAP